MMRPAPLWIVPPYGHGESPASFVSRLAAANFIDGPRIFCTDLKLQFQDVVDGFPDALNTIAWAAGISAESLTANAIRRPVRGKPEYTLRGERLVRTSLSRNRIRVCPECVRADIGSAHKYPDLAAFSRTIWLISSIRSCPKHQVALVEIARDPGALHAHDFSRIARAHLGPAQARALPTRQQETSSLETYLLTRLERPAPQAPFLDGLEFHVAARICEVIGAVAVFGPKCKSLNEEQWHLAGHKGFAIAEDGEPAIKQLLLDLQRDFPYRRSGKEGPNAIYGRIFKALMKFRHSAYAPVRALVSRHTIETMPLAAGENILGHVLSTRLIHSVRTAALQTRMNPVTIRGILLNEGVISPASDAICSNLVTFPVKAAGNLIDRLTGAMQMIGLANYLYIGRRQTLSLVRAGILKPISKGGGNKKLRLLFAKSDVDAFLDQLALDASPIEYLDADMADLTTAGFRTNTAVNVIVQLILDRRLRWVGKLDGKTGLSSVVINVLEAINILFKPFAREVPISAVPKELGVKRRVVTELTISGLLPMYDATVSRTHRRRKVCLRSDIDFFKENFITLLKIARWRGISVYKVKAMLDNAGERPAFQPENFSSSFYRRADLPPSFRPPN